MIEFISNLSTFELFFLVCAIGGTLIFVIRTILMFAGISGAEADCDLSLDTDLDGASDSDSDDSFSFISVQSVTSFLMMFGWVGLAMMVESGLSAFIAILGGIAAGLITVLILKKIFKFFLGFKSDGTMRIKTALGAPGKVYLRIPAEGSGQIEVEVDGRLKIFDAVSKSKEEIKTGEAVTVVWIQDNNVLVVEKDYRDEGGRLV